MMRILGPDRAVVVAGGRMMRMLGPGWSGGSGRVGGVWRLLPCCLFRLARGWGRMRLFFASLALVGLEVMGLGGRAVGRRGAEIADQGPVAGVPQAVHWSLSRGCVLSPGGLWAMARRPGCR